MAKSFVRNTNPDSKPTYLFTYSANHARGSTNIRIRQQKLRFFFVSLNSLSINRDSFNHKKIAWK